MIKLDNVVYSVIDGDKTRKILNELSLEIKESGVTLITGASGAGKTTLMYAISGMLESIDSGSINVNGRSIYELKVSDRDEFRLNNIGMIFQTYNLFSNWSVKENIFLPIYAMNKKVTNIHKNDMIKYSKMLGIESLLEKEVVNLSGGEQQRISIIRSFINDPDLILCDEPTANLDSENSKVFFELLRKMAIETQKTIVVVSHDEIAKSYSDRVYNLVDGQII